VVDTPASVVRANGRTEHSGNYLVLVDAAWQYCFAADGQQINALARSSEELSDICDVVLRLLAANVVHSVILETWSFLAGASINAPTLAYLMEQCQSLKALTLEQIVLEEDHCRVLGALSRPGLEIK
jgi:hypothetical protein